MLRYLRIVVSIAVLASILFVFLDYTGAVSAFAGWLPRWQVVPAFLALNLIAIVVLLLGTLLFGRLYCSVLCPLGISQDFVIWLRRITAPKRKRRPGLFRFATEKKVLRYSFLAIFLLLLAAGFAALLPSSFAGLLDPYSIFGRAAGQFGVPLWRMGLGAVADSAAEHGTYILDAQPAVSAFIYPVAAIAAIQLIIVAVMAWRSGRGYCNTVCPVGTFLGFLSRFSLLRPVIDTSRCNGCGSCGRHCKAKCINTKAHEIDYSRCVVCFDCLNSCTQGAIRYTSRRKAKTAEESTAPAATSATTAVSPSAVTTATDTSRRAFLAGLAIAGSSAVVMAADKSVDGGLAPLKKKQRHSGVAPTIPAGAVSLRNLRSHCTACQLCISACPNGVLRPSLNADGFMQPVMHFTEGFCRPECTACADVCPTGALKPIALDVKAVTKIGTATVNFDKCISAAYGQTCGNCATHCPVHAIHMKRDAEGRVRPLVNAEICIGCGSCEYHCPSGTVGQLSSREAAIYVEGLDQHRII
ncbi:MAG: 4Fe-4S binding protein [Muribaculaceae bacterium]|nr:4Fe-4S binding protein [Muribaculaceae bacterium]